MLYFIFRRVIIMSNREIAQSIIDSIPDSQMGYIVNLLQNWYMTLEEATDDAFCEKLYEDYLNDDDPEKDNGVQIEQFAQSLGITL